MNERIKELAGKALDQAVPETWTTLTPEQLEKVQEKFAELVVQDYAKKTIQGLMNDPAFVQAMDEHYEKKWAHRFDQHQELNDE